MKAAFKTLSVIVLVSIFSLATPHKVVAQDDQQDTTPVNFQVFYDELGPYGDWVLYPGYGYVWIPDVDASFSPYSTSGYWAFGDVGWTWVSYYSWGWGPFHYGRWFYDGMYGWMWVPGYAWGPAWVVWSRAPGYYGWAPLGPRMSVNVAISAIPAERWVFVNERHMGEPEIEHFYAPRTNNVTIIKNTTIINNVRVDNVRHVTYTAGPDVKEVQKVTGKSVNAISVRDYEKPGHDMKQNEYHVYRPQIPKQQGNAPKPAPHKIIDMHQVRPWSQRHATPPPMPFKRPGG